MSSSSEESDEANGGNSTDNTKHSEETERTGSVWSAISEGGILKTTTIEIKVETDEGLSSSTRSSSTVPKEWEEALPLDIEEAPSELLSTVIEQGRLAKDRRSPQESEH